MSDATGPDFKSVWQMLGIDTGNLGCIMLDTEPLLVHDIIPDEALYDSLESEHVKGIVSETVPHCTLLYGLMRSGPELRTHVEMVLDGWSAGDVNVDKVGFFYGDDDGTPMITIIALLEQTPTLLEANGRLRKLPHIDTFPDYHPHITLAYVKADSNWKEYVDKLNDRYAGKPVGVRSLNYGN